MTLSRNVLAAAAAATLLFPAAASAHTDGLKLGHLFGNEASMGLHLGNTIGVHADENASTTLRVDRDHEGDRDDDRGEHASTTARAFVASTTAARLSAKAERLLSVTDFMGSLSGNLSARIASSSLSPSSTAEAQAKLSDYNANVAGAQTQAQAALGIASNIASSTASTTLVSEAKADLKAAQGFIRAAQQDLRNLLKVIFSF